MGGRVLLVLRDGLLHIGDRILQRLGDARHRLRVRLLQLRGTLFQHLLRHIHELGITFLLLLEFLTLRCFHLLVQQFQLTALRLRLGMQRLVLLLQMVHPTRDSVQLFVAHRQLDILLAALDTKRVHLTVHQQIQHHATY